MDERRTVRVVRRVDEVEPHPELAQQGERHAEVGADQLERHRRFRHRLTIAFFRAPCHDRGSCTRRWRGRVMDKFEGRRMDGAEFHDVSLAGAKFDDVNLSNARFSNVNLSSVSIENANIKGLRIFGY